MAAPLEPWEGARPLDSFQIVGLSLTDILHQPNGMVHFGEPCRIWTQAGYSDSGSNSGQAGTDVVRRPDPSMRSQVVNFAQRSQGMRRAAEHLRQFTIPHFIRSSNLHEHLPMTRPSYSFSSRYEATISSTVGDSASNIRIPRGKPTARSEDDPVQLFCDIDEDIVRDHVGLPTQRRN